MEDGGGVVREGGGPEVPTAVPCPYPHCGAVFSGKHANGNCKKHVRKAHAEWDLARLDLQRRSRGIIRASVRNRQQSATAAPPAGAVRASRPTVSGTSGVISGVRRKSTAMTSSSHLGEHGGRGGCFGEDSAPDKLLRPTAPGSSSSKGGFSKEYVSRMLARMRELQEEVATLRQAQAQQRMRTTGLPGRCARHTRSSRQVRLGCRGSCTQRGRGWCGLSGQLCTKCGEMAPACTAKHVSGRRTCGQWSRWCRLVDRRRSSSLLAAAGSTSCSPAPRTTLSCATARLTDAGAGSV